MLPPASHVPPVPFRPRLPTTMLLLPMHHDATALSLLCLQAGLGATVLPPQCLPSSATRSLLPPRTTRSTRSLLLKASSTSLTATPSSPATIVTPLFDQDPSRSVTSRSTPCHVPSPSLTSQSLTIPRLSPTLVPISSRSQCPTWVSVTRRISLCLL